MYASKVLNALVTCVDKSTANDRDDVVNIVLNSKIPEERKYNQLLMIVIGVST